MGRNQRKLSSGKHNWHHVTEQSRLGICHWSQFHWTLNPIAAAKFSTLFATPGFSCPHVVNFLTVPESYLASLLQDSKSQVEISNSLNLGHLLPRNERGRDHLLPAAYL